MSTLPFLLSVADELDNINSQSYLDDFGLGFHPHRQYYRTPTIQLSLPAGTEWMEERQRYRPHKYYDESLNNLQPTSEEDGAQNADDECNATSADDDRTGNGGGPSTSAASGSRQKYTSALNSNDLAKGGGDSGNVLDDDNIDNSVQLYNLSKKCCKHYYRHNASDHHHQHSHCHKSGGGAALGRGEKEKSSSGGYRLHPKCMEGNHSSSEESLQKVSSSIEFLTCFLLKKTRPSKHSGSGSGSGSGDGSGSGRKS